MAQGEQPLTTSTPGVANVCQHCASFDNTKRGTCWLEVRCCVCGMLHVVYNNAAYDYLKYKK